MSAFHLLAAYGLCFGLMQDKAPFITVPLRRLPLVGWFFTALLECAFCTGFHCGWMVYLLEIMRNGVEPSWYADIVLYVFASASFCLVADVGIHWLVDNTSEAGT